MYGSPRNYLKTRRHVHQVSLCWPLKAALSHEVDKTRLTLGILKKTEGECRHIQALITLREKDKSANTTLP